MSIYIYTHTRTPMSKLICDRKTFLNFASLVTSMLAVFEKNVDAMQVHLAHQFVLYHSAVVDHGWLLHCLVELAKENESKRVFIRGTDRLRNIRSFVHE